MQHYIHQTHHPRPLQLHEGVHCETLFSSPFKHRSVSGDGGQGLESFESLIALHDPLQLPVIVCVRVCVCVC
jgi:hypothetical protein